MTKLVPTIGIEVHAELKTKSKVFSNSTNTYGEIANSKTNEIDLGYPGTLPSLNKEVVNLALKAAIAMNCIIENKMYFDRKNYFYPDLPKGYQITQATTPIGHDGYIEIEVNGEKKQIGIERIHIEEDTSKSIHEGESTLLDFNRAGIPLIEIVTKPVIKSGEEAVLYLEKLREILLYAKISDVKIEEGSMRCDANVSLKEEFSDTLGTKTEVKNIGSITNVRLAINYEIKRQKEMLANEESIIEQTRKFDDKKGITILMRNKESSNDYRYLPEPDIPCIYIDQAWIDQTKKNIPLLPDELRVKYFNLGINDIAIKALINRPDISLFLKDLIENSVNPVISANLLTGDVLGYLNKSNQLIDQTKLNNTNFSSLVKLLEKGEISSKIGKEILIDIITIGGDVNDILKTKGISQINDEGIIIAIIKKVITNNESVIIDYKNGNQRAIKFLVGQVMKESNGQANPNGLIDKLIKEINKC